MAACSSEFNSTKGRNAFSALARTAQTIVLAPVLSQPDSQIYNFGSQASQGVAITPLNFDNTVTSDDSGMTYSCKFDRFVDASVLTGSDCVDLPASALSFSTSTGVLSWTPDSSAFGAYEIEVTGTNSTASDSKIVVIDVKQPYATANLLGYWDAGFARTDGGQGTNTSLSLIDLTGGGISGVFHSFGSLVTSGFDGSLPDTSVGETANPYRIVFDGVDDRVSLGNTYNGQSEFYFDLWTNPTTASAKYSNIMSNAESGKGTQLSQNYSGDGRVQIVVGDVRSYADEVLADSPVAYWRLDETAGIVATDSGTNALTATYMNTPTLGTSGAISDNTTAMTGTGAGLGCAQAPANALLDLTDAITIEFWFNFTVVEEKYWLQKGNDYFDILTYAADNGKITFYISTIGGLRTANAFNDGHWHYLVASYDKNAGANNMNIYIDNVLEGTLTSVAAINSASTTLGIGSNFLCSSGGTNASLDEIAIYNSVLSSPRMTAHYNAASRPTCRSTSSLTNGSWSQIAASFIGGNTLSLFFNGAQECTVTASGIYTGSSSDLTIGASASNTNHFDGSIADFRIYSTGSAAVNTANFNATRHRFQ